MSFSFTPEQLEFRDAVRDLLQRECTPEVVRAGHSPELWKHLAATGVIGLLAPETSGGMALTEIDLVLLHEEAGRACLPGPFAESAAVAVPLLRDAAPDEVRDRWLPAIANGEAVATVWLERNGFVTDADVADVVIAQRADALHALPASDLEPYTEVSVDPTRHVSTFEWDPDERSLLTHGESALVAIEAAFDRGALAAAAELTGGAARMIELGAAYAKEREQFGVAIGTFQAVKHLLADALVRVEFARPAVYRAAHSVAVGAPNRSRDVSMAKAMASDAAIGSARASLQVHGAIGYTQEHDLHLWLRRARALANAWGTASWHRERVARAILS